MKKKKYLNLVKIIILNANKNGKLTNDYLNFQTTLAMYDVNLFELSLYLQIFYSDKLPIL